MLPCRVSDRVSDRFKIMPTPPETHFDATFLLKQTTRPKNVKVSQFYDSIEVKAAMGLLEEPIETKIGRGGYTWIHNDLRQLFDQWLSEVGKGRGKRNTLQGTVNAN